MFIMHKAISTTYVVRRPSLISKVLVPGMYFTSIMSVDKYLMHIKLVTLLDSSRTTDFQGNAQL